MKQAEHKMKSVNVQMTADIDERLAEFQGGSRSAAVRDVMAAIIAAWNAGNRSAMESAMDLALKTSWRARRKSEETDDTDWIKGIVWITTEMHEEIEEIIAGTGVHVSDILRGALIGATGADIASISDDEKPEEKTIEEAQS